MSWLALWRRAWSRCSRKGPVVAPLRSPRSRMMVWPWLSCGGPEVVSLYGMAGRVRHVLRSRDVNGCGAGRCLVPDMAAFVVPAGFRIAVVLAGFGERHGMGGAENVDRR